ncbi:MAG: glycosyl hydrolase [Oligosphaeraceae bacterium]
MLEQLLSQIHCPGPEFRGAPFWAWNGKLSPGELRRQIRLFHDMGLGGFFMHARVGLGTPYLGPEWFEAVRACLDEAEKLGMKAWLYDEDRWPSGAAGGLVTKDPQYRQRHLRLTLLDALPREGLPRERLGLFAARIQGNDATRVRPFLPEGDTLHDGESLLLFQCVTAEPDSWYNDQTYLDTMNPRAVERFIQVTHEAYRREISQTFGKTVPGIFTDEPNYIHTWDRHFRPWTEALPREFQARHGYDLLPHLPELFFYVDGEHFSQARRDYYETATSLYVNAFARLIGEWCQKNGLAFTGHDLEEDTPMHQTLVSGSAMRFYEYQQQPGIDLLTEHWGIFDTAKQCSSMAHQFGRPWRLSETYGCTGWDFPFMGHKALGDWQYALGINFRCQHLAWYTMAAEAKRDYPASISYQSPWHQDFPVVEDYFARLGAALSEGEEQRDLLVVHPLESHWGTTIPGIRNTPEGKAEDATLHTLSNLLLGGNLDFDYGDEDVMARHARVENRRILVNLAGYRAVLLPEMLTVRQSTLALLDAFVKEGGKVFYLGDAPARVDGAPSPLARQSYQAYQPVTRDTLVASLEGAARRVSVTDEEGRQVEPALHLLRKAQDHQTLFLCNFATPFGNQTEYPLVRERTLSWRQVTVAVKAAPGDTAYELNLMTGDLVRVPCRHEGDSLVLQTRLLPLESHLFFLTDKSLPANPPAAAPALKGESIPLPANGWRVELDDPNVLVLDHALGTVDGKSLGTRYILHLDDHIRKELLHGSPRGYSMVQPWLRQEKAREEHTLDLQLEYSFRCQTIPRESCFLALERPELYEITLNGKRVASDADHGWWCDLSLRKLPLPADALRIGENHLTLRCQYHLGLPGLECIYLLGEFGVEEDTLTAPVQTLSMGDWCQQGLPYYAGNLIYTHAIDLPWDEKKPCLLSLEEWRGVSLAVSVNGSPWQALPWPPFQLDVSRFLKNGRNLFSIRVIGHRRNSHGPFYAKKGAWPDWTGPEQFKEYISPRKCLVPCGLLTPPRLLF